MSHQFIIISGNIGVGKSTLTTQLANTLGWQAYPEAFASNPYLADFYGDMPRWSFHSQVYFLAQRLKHHHAISQFPGDVIQDRSIYEDAEIFARNLQLQGKMDARDYQTYFDLYEGIRAFLPAPTLVVYLYAPVGFLAERIAGRGRDYERQISIDYLAQLNTLYETWATHWEASPLLRIDTSAYDFLNDTQDLDKIVQQIQDQLN